MRGKWRFANPVIALAEQQIEKYELKAQEERFE